MGGEPGFGSVGGVTAGERDQLPERPLRPDRLDPDDEPEPELRVPELPEDERGGLLTVPEDRGCGGGLDVLGCGDGDDVLGCGVAEGRETVPPDGASAPDLRETRDEDPERVVAPEERPTEPERVVPTEPVRVDPLRVLEPTEERVVPVEPLSGRVRVTPELPLRLTSLVVDTEPDPVRVPEP